MQRGSQTFLPSPSVCRHGPRLLVITACIFAIASLAHPARELYGQEAGAQSDSPTSLSGPLKIVKLLWKSNPGTAASTLSRSILTAVERDAIAELRQSLSVLLAETEAVVAAANESDPRYAASLATQALLDSESSHWEPRLARALDNLGGGEQAELLWRVWMATGPQAAGEYLALALRQPQGSPESAAWKSVMIREALAADRQRTAMLVLEVWSDLDAKQQTATIEPLTVNATSMHLLLTAIESGHVSKDLLNTNQLRKWLASGDAAIASKIESIWGSIRQADDAERQRLVAETLARLQSGARGSAAKGAQVFDRVCSQCHLLHGRGFEVGPNISGNGRGNLQQLVSNVLDPSLVIGEAFQAKTVLTYDGEVISGLVAAENAQFLKLKVQGGKLVEFDKEEDIEQIKTSTKSLMPEGVEGQMTEQELNDLFAYLCLLKPLGSEDNELIPGTPENFVQP